MELTEFLICPTCKSPDLDTGKLIIFQDAYLEGSFICKKCSAFHQFKDGILNLAPETRMNQAYSDFWERAKHDVVDGDLTQEKDFFHQQRDRFLGRTFLEAGCGNGRQMNHFIHLGYEILVFVDISSAVKDCREKFMKMRSPEQRAIFIQCELTQIPIRSQSIEVMWSGGTVGLLKDQRAAIDEFARITTSRMNISVLTEKTITGKVYLWSNAVKPIINRIENFNFLYSLAGVAANFILLTLRLIRFSGIRTSFLNEKTLSNLLDNPQSKRRLQWGLYDPIVLPHVEKHPDQFYIDTAKNLGFKLKNHELENICDFFFFEKNGEWRTIV